MTLRDEIIAARRALDVLTMDIEPSSSTGAEDDDDELSAREALLAHPHRADAPKRRRRAVPALTPRVRDGQRVRRRPDARRKLARRHHHRVRPQLVDLDASSRPTVKSARGRLRAQLGVSLTNREIERAIERASISNSHFRGIHHQSFHRPLARARAVAALPRHHVASSSSTSTARSSTPNNSSTRSSAPSLDLDPSLAPSRVHDVLEKSAGRAARCLSSRRARARAAHHR